MDASRGGRPTGPAELISREMVRLMRAAAGRGPTKARTTIGRDHVLVMFEETLNAGERNLVEHGMTDQVEAVRAGYQEILREEATAMIERTLDRKVLGFMSTNNFEPDLAAEVFILEPQSGDGAGAEVHEGEHLEH